MSRIILATLNARYIHSSLGLRYIRANMGELINETEIREFTLDSRPIDICEQLLGADTQIIGFGVYIWNVQQTTAVVRLLKTLRPDIHIVIGGPEVSYEFDDQEIFQLCDVLVCGQGDSVFAEICYNLLDGRRPAGKIVHASNPSPQTLRLPYRFYTDEDILNRIIYVEASRGCPYKCEFCLSALDKSAVPFDLDIFLQEMQQLYARGARHFKFVDRTFNLKVDNCARILEFFLDKLQQEPLFLHFELIPDHLPDRLKALIKCFPDNSLQFEIGIQSLNPEVQKLINRRQDNNRTTSNLVWLRDNTRAHIHVDLIAGLPGEELQSFADGFNRLIAMRPHEIQVGILKCLKGTPISRHTDTFNMRFNPDPPYNILCNELIDFDTMQRVSRFARYWDMVANSGRFSHVLGLLLAESPFANFMKFSDWLYASTGQTYQIALKRLFSLVYEGLLQCFNIDEELLRSQLMQDFQRSAIKGKPEFHMPSLPSRRSGQDRQARRQQQHVR